MSELEIQRLADFLVTRCPQEIGADNFKTGESAVGVAVRMIARMANGISNALVALNAPGDVDLEILLGEIEEILLEARGQWRHDHTSPITTLKTRFPLTPDQAQKQHIRFARAYAGTLGSAREKESSG